MFSLTIIFSLVVSTSQDPVVCCKQGPSVCTPLQLYPYLPMYNKDPPCLALLCKRAAPAASACECGCVWVCCVSSPDVAMFHEFHGFVKAHVLYWLLLFLPCFRCMDGWPSLNVDHLFAPHCCHAQGLLPTRLGIASPLKHCSLTDGIGSTAGSLQQIVCCLASHTACASICLCSLLVFFFHQRGVCCLCAFHTA